MIKQGYLIKVVEGHGDEETRDWMVGPRGKIEVGNRGVRELVVQVYGENAPDDLAKRVKSSLGIQGAEAEEVEANPEAEVEVEVEARQVAGGEASRQRRSRRRPADADDED